MTGAPTPDVSTEPRTLDADDELQRIYELIPDRSTDT